MSLFDRLSARLRIPTPEETLPGRDTTVSVPEAHHVTGRSLTPPWPESLDCAIFALGCFWGAEKRYWEQEGVTTTAAGYTAGSTPNPTYEEVCSGGTGHTECVLVVFDPHVVTYSELLRLFWEGHDPTQGMRQGNDVGTQYRSGIYTHSESQSREANHSKAAYERELTRAGHGPITTEIQFDVS